MVTWDQRATPRCASDGACTPRPWASRFDPAVGDVVFDLGANRGEYAEVFAGEGARIVAVEPNTAFTTRLRRWLERLTSVRCSPRSATNRELLSLTCAVNPVSAPSLIRALSGSKSHLTTKR